MYGRPAPYYSAPRYNNFHGPKQRVLGNQAGNVAPAWRSASGPATQAAQAHRQQQAVGSKILLTQLPLDVGEREVEELFKKTVGPLKESFLIYNSQGKTKGMAVVVFQRPGDAMEARKKYNGKFVDGRRPIRIEIISDGVPIPTGPAAAAAAPSVSKSAPMSLLDRIDKRTVPSSSTRNDNLPRQVTAAAAIRANAKTKANAAASSSLSAQTAPPAHRRTKKGPKRLKKQNVQFPKFSSNTSQKASSKAPTREQLDQEMEDYRADAPLTNGDGY